MSIESVYDRWEEANKPYLDSCRGKFVAVAFSAGKDSSACLHLLSRVRERYDFHLGAYLYAFPQHRYLPGTTEPIEAFWKPHIDAFTVKRSDITDDILHEAEARGDDPCRPCQDLRKGALPDIFELAGTPIEETVVASGHSLRDLAGYALHQFTENAFGENHPKTDEIRRDRFLEISQRFYPFLTMPEGYSIYRPMLFLDAEEISGICAQNALPLLPVPCTYSQRRPKKVLSGYYEQFGFHFTYSGVLDFAKRYLDLPDKTEFERMTREEYLTKRF